MASVCPGRDVAFCSKHSPTILEDSGDGFLAQTDCDTLRFLQSLSSYQVRQGYWIGQATPNRGGNVRQVICGAQGATLAFVTTATMLADALTKALVHCPSLLAAMNALRHVFADVLRAYTNSENGDWLSADSISRTLWTRASLKPCSVS